MTEQKPELAVRMADEWLEKNRKTETWRLINMLRDELVRAQDKLNAPKTPEDPRFNIGTAEAWREDVHDPELREFLDALDGHELIEACKVWWTEFNIGRREFRDFKGSTNADAARDFANKAVLSVKESGAGTNTPAITPHQLIMGDPVYYGKKAASEAAAARRDDDADALAWYERLKDSDFKKALSTLGSRDLTTAYLEWWARYSEAIREAPSNRRGKGVSEDDAKAAGDKARAAVIAQLP